MPLPFESHYTFLHFLPLVSSAHLDETYVQYHIELYASFVVFDREKNNMPGEFMVFEIFFKDEFFDWIEKKAFELNEIGILIVFL